jgi:hypothetical protein
LREFDDRRSEMEDLCDLEHFKVHK